MRPLLPALLCCLLCTTAHAAGTAIDQAADSIRERFPDTPIYVLGELHGTRETPALALALSERLLASGPVTVALEIPVDEQARLSAFMTEQDEPAAVATLLAGDFWQRPRDQSDGRRSEAMRDLLLALRRLHARQPTLDVALFDPGNVDGRDRRMAERLQALDATRDGDRIVVLTGNYHARRTPPDGATFKGQPITPPAPMAGQLPARHAVSIDISARRGTFWACTWGCAEQTIDAAPDRPADDRVELRLLDADTDGYDARLWLPQVSASPPAEPNA